MAGTTQHDRKPAKIKAQQAELTLGDGHREFVLQKKAGPPLPTGHLMQQWPWNRQHAAMAAMGKSTTAGFTLCFDITPASLQGRSKRDRKGSSIGTDAKRERLLTHTYFKH